MQKRMRWRRRHIIAALSLSMSPLVFQCFTIDFTANSLELCFRNSSESSQRLEHQSHDNLGSTLELEGDDIPPSDEDIDESETDVVWSDDNL